MIGFRYRNVVLAAAAALLAQSLSLPAEARGNPGIAGMKEISNVDGPVLSAPARSRSEAARLRRPCQRVAAYVPMLFIGVGW